MTSCGVRKSVGGRGRAVMRSTPGAARWAPSLRRAWAATGGMLALLAANLSASAGEAAATVHGVTEFSSYAYVQDGKVAGPATEIAEATLRGAGVSDYRIDLYPWARAYDLALREPNVLIYLIARTPEREHRFHWVGEVTRMEYALFRIAGRRDAPLAGLDEARRHVVGVTRDDLRHHYLRGQGFQKLVVSGEPVDSFRKLVSGQVDLIPLARTDLKPLCEQAEFDCGRLEPVLPLPELSTGLYLAYSAATPHALVERTRLAFERLRQTGGLRAAQSVPGRPAAR